MGTTGRRKILRILRHELTKESPSPIVGVAGIDLAQEPHILSALNFLQKNGRVLLAGLWSPSEKLRDTMGDFLKIADENRFPELDDLLRSGVSARGRRIDALLLLGKVENRQEEIRKILFQKIHLLANIPLSHTARESESLIDTAAGKGAHLGVIHSGRYQAIHAEPLWAVREHRLGEIMHVRIDRPRPIRSDPNAALDEIPADLYRDVYLARAWANSPVISVAAHMESRQRRGKFVSVCLVSFQHAGGGWTTLHQTDTIGPATEVCEIHGVEGSIRIDQQDNAWYLCRSSVKTDGTHWERKEPGPETLRGGLPMDELAPETEARPYARALDDAFTSIARGLPPPVDGREAWLNLCAIDAIRESAQTGKVIQVDISFPR